MSNAGIDPSRLYSALLNSGLAIKDNALYQVIYNLIGQVVKLTSDAAAASSSSSSSATVINNTIVQLIEDNSGADEPSIMMIGGSGGSSNLTIAQVAARVAVGI